MAPAPKSPATKAEQMEIGKILSPARLGENVRGPTDARIRSWIRITRDDKTPADEPPEPPPNGGVVHPESHGNRHLNLMNYLNHLRGRMCEIPIVRSLGDSGAGGFGGAPHVQTGGSCGIPGAPPLLLGWCT